MLQAESLLGPESLKLRSPVWERSMAEVSRNQQMLAGAAEGAVLLFPPSFCAWMQRWTPACVLCLSGRDRPLASGVSSSVSWLWAEPDLGSHPFVSVTCSMSLIREVLWVFKQLALFPGFFKPPLVMLPGEGATEIRLKPLAIFCICIFLIWAIVSLKP